MIEPRRERFELVGVVHLAALPGEPRNTLALDRIIEAALRDVAAYAEGGATALIVENFGDVPFHAGAVEPHTVAAMTLAVDAVRRAVRLPIGVNVLRNDARAAVGIAAMTGASFVRVNVHTGASVTDQGIITGRAAETLRYLKRLGGEIRIWADVHVKHGTPLGRETIEDAAEDAATRGLADALVVSGRGTGYATDPDHARRVRATLPDTPLYVGSGVSPDIVPALAPYVDGFIAGTWAKADGQVRNPVDSARVRRLSEAIRAARERAAPSPGPARRSAGSR